MCSAGDENSMTCGVADAVCGLLDNAMASCSFVSISLFGATFIIGSVGLSLALTTLIDVSVCGMSASAWFVSQQWVSFFCDHPSPVLSHLILFSLNST